MASKPKVVRIIARLSVGGPVRQVCMLHDRLLPYFDTYLVTGSLADHEADMSHLLESERNVYRIPEMSREICFWADLVSFWKLFRFLRREKPEIVHTHTAKGGALGRVASWLAGVPVIVHTYHGHVFQGYFGPIKSRAYVIIERLLGHLCTRVITISESQFCDLCLRFRVAPSSKTSIVHNGFELAHFSGKSRGDARNNWRIPADKKVVVWAGRLVPVKDIDLLIQVIRRLGGAQSKFYFLVVGDGPERPKLESELAVCSNVRLLGWRNDMAAIWSAADLALLTSRNEGTPTVLIEAMAAGCPFVSTNVGAVQDLALGPIEELPMDMGKRAANGFLTRCDPDAIVYCIEALAADSEAAREMGRAGQSFVLNSFAASRLIEEIKLLYERLLDERRDMIAAGPPLTKQTGVQRTRVV